MRLFEILIFLITILCTCMKASAEQLVVYAEDARPFVYLENDKVTSPTSEYIRALVTRAGYTPDIRLMSWSGIMHTAEANQPVVFFPLARTKEREAKYQWIGTIVRFQDYRLYRLAKRTDIVVKKLSDAKKYRIGAIEADAREQYLLENNFRYRKEAELTSIVDNKEGMRLLQVGRLDLLPLSLENFNALCPPHCADYEAVFNLNLNLNLDLQLAANKATPHEVISRLRRAYDALEKEGTRARMVTTNQHAQ